MKYRFLALFILVIAVAFTAGCTESPAPAATPVPTDTQTPAIVTPAPVETLSLGQEYLHKKYSFTGEKDVFTEQFRVTNDPWALDFVVNPTNTDPQYTWFEVTVTNIDNGHKDTFGYGRTYALERHQQHPMYNDGPYKLEFRGNRVSVDVKVAKRNP